MTRDVQDAQVPRRSWMTESGPDRIDSSLRSSGRTVLVASESNRLV
jgi:hypothetical protein